MKENRGSEQRTFCRLPSSRSHQITTGLVVVVAAAAAAEAAQRALGDSERWSRPCRRNVTLVDWLLVECSKQQQQYSSAVDEWVVKWQERDLELVEGYGKVRKAV